MAELHFKSLKKIYDGGVLAVDDFNLKVKDKEFIVFVGPSGCGKSTTLRMVAGLEEITEGDLYIDEKRVNHIPPKDRDIAMVFQSYALYPHMSVYDNMAFGLKLRRVPKEDIRERVNKAADLLGISELLNRKPKALSGGQRQRVALGRAIVRNAKVFLMDEPLSNLDAKLRVKMRGELIKLHARIETTTIYVTHDQSEAMTMADRIVVMNKGYIQQVGSPKEIYDNPNNMFVGGFIGTPPMNFIEGKVSRDGVFENKDMKIKIPGAQHKILKDNDMIEKLVVLGIRPEDIHDDKRRIQAHPDMVVEVPVDVSELLGNETNITSTINGASIVARIDARTDIKLGDTLDMVFDTKKSHFFNPDTEERLV